MIKVNKEKLSQIKKDNCKNTAKGLISKYDWIFDSDTNPKLLNKNEFIEYRSILRNLIINPIENPEWPNPPKEHWS